MNIRMIAALTGLACAAAFTAVPHVLAQSPASMPASRPSRGGARGIVEPGARVVELAKGFQFTEGPAVDREGNVFFSDVRASRTYKWSKDRKVSLVRKDTGGANGLAFDKDGNLLACEGAGGRIVSIDAKGNVTVVAGAYGGKPFNRPNDLWIDPKGGVYFSDPLYGRGSRRQDGEHVYYVTPDRKKVVRVIDDMVRPNGLAGTPDGKTLYVADAGAGRTYRYAVNADGTLRDRMLFVAKGSDGMKLDRNGNVYLTAGAVWVYNPAGKQIAKIEVPLRPTNLCFAGPDGRTLFITARSAIYAVKTTVGGGAPSPKRGARTRPAAKRETPRVRLPSPPGEHVAKIQALGGDCWLLLGSPAADSRWGKARGRSWTPEMVYVPHLRAALLCGQGPHGMVKPDGHYLDDIWAYDINAHRWVCLYPGAGVKTLKLKLDEHGFEVNDKGEHVPVAYIGHGYNHLTYVPELRKLMILHTFDPWWKRAIPQRNRWLEVPKDKYGDAYSQGKLNLRFCDPIFFDPQTGRFERRFVPGRKLPGGQDYGVLEYLPGRKQAFLLHKGRAWLYDFAANTWTDTGAKADIGYDANGVYDPKRGRVYVFRGRFWSYDLKANRWSEVKAKNQPEKLGRCNYATVTYDSAADVVVYMEWKSRSVQVYDPRKNAWGKVSPSPKVQDADMRRRRNANGFYDPVLNVHLYHFAGDGRANGVVLAYRYRRARR